MKLEEDYSRQKAIDADQRMSSRHSHNVGHPPRMGFPKDTRLAAHDTSSHDIASGGEDYPFDGFTPLLEDEFTSRHVEDETRGDSASSDNTHDNGQVIYAARATSTGNAPTSVVVPVHYLLSVAVVMMVIGVCFASMPHVKKCAKSFRGSSSYGSFALNAHIDKLLNYM